MNDGVKGCVGSELEGGGLLTMRGKASTGGTARGLLATIGRELGMEMICRD